MTKGEKEIRKQNVQQLMDKGLNQGDIAATLGIHRTTVKRICDEIEQSATNGAILTDTAQNVITHTINPKQQVEALNARLTDMWETASDPNEIFTLNEQILKQLKFYIELCEKLYNVQRVEVFMEAVMEAMEETAPEIVYEFKQRLNRKAAMAGQRFEL